MKVRIVKCYDNMAWYKDKIGEVVDILDKFYLKNYESRHFEEIVYGEERIKNRDFLFRKLKLEHPTEFFLNIDDIITLREDNLSQLELENNIYFSETSKSI